MIKILFQYSEQIANFAIKANNLVLSMDSNNDMEYLRLASKKHEILICPDREFTLIVLQNPKEE